MNYTRGKQRGIQQRQKKPTRQAARYRTRNRMNVKQFGSLGIAVTPTRYGGIECGRMRGIILVTLER